MRSLIIFAVALTASQTFAEGAPYAGQEARAIKALSSDRVEGLRAGAGLGYAKAAELNGWPGPLHVLELADALALSATQIDHVKAIRAEMLAQARPLGEELIAAEAALDALFADGAPEAEAVAVVTAEIGGIEARLRAAHLAAHLETTPILNRHQRMLYARARGYSGAGHKHGGHY